MEPLRSNTRIVMMLSLAGVMLASVSTFAEDPKDLPETCPSGWNLATNRVTVPPSKDAHPADHNAWSMAYITVDIPVDAEIFEVSGPAKHPKFCWKEQADTTFGCMYSEGPTDKWGRWRDWHPGQPSPKGHDFKRYEVRFQNESTDRTRNALLIVCYK